jgi:hypothetical protein
VKFVKFCGFSIFTFFQNTRNDPFHPLRKKFYLLEHPFYPLHPFTMVFVFGNFLQWICVLVMKRLNLDSLIGINMRNQMLDTYIRIDVQNGGKSPLLTGEHTIGLSTKYLPFRVTPPLNSVNKAFAENTH